MIKEIKLLLVKIKLRNADILKVNLSIILLIMEMLKKCQIFF